MPHLHDPRRDRSPRLYDANRPLPVQRLASGPEGRARPRADSSPHRAPSGADGNFGDAKPIGEGVHELRVHYGPGYRIYFARQGRAVLVLLCAGDKRTQPRDIERAKRYWRAHKNANRPLS